MLISDDNEKAEDDSKTPGIEVETQVQGESTFKQMDTITGSTEDVLKEVLKDYPGDDSTLTN